LSSAMVSPLRGRYTGGKFQLSQWAVSREMVRKLGFARALWRLRHNTAVLRRTSRRIMRADEPALTVPTAKHFWFTEALESAFAAR
jgi:hypothetical protein